MESGDAKLTESEWRALKKQFSAYASFSKMLENNVTSSLPLSRVREILESNAHKQLLRLLELDAEAKPRIDALHDVERLVYAWCHLGELMRNFVSFEQFAAHERSLFQVGQLILDGRRALLCFNVDGEESLSNHAQLASRSNCYLVYCRCTKHETTRYICAAFTDGSGDQLYVGRRGVFYASDGQEFDAVVVQTVEHAIGLREAAVRPYKRALRFLERTILPQASAAVSSTVGEAAKKLDVSVPLTIFVGAMSTAIATFLHGFLQLGWLMPLGVAGVCAGISGPSVAVAFLKSRRRHLGPILEASGWAINISPRISLRIGRSMTSVVPGQLQANGVVGRILAAGTVLAFALGGGALYWYRNELVQPLIDALEEQQRKTKDGNASK